MVWVVRTVEGRIRCAPDGFVRYGSRRVEEGGKDTGYRFVGRVLTGPEGQTTFFIIHVPYEVLFSRISNTHTLNFLLYRNVSNFSPCYFLSALQDDT